MRNKLYDAKGGTGADDNDVCGSRGINAMVAKTISQEMKLLYNTIVQVRGNI